MLEIKGTYNTAYVMLDELDEVTKSQIHDFVNDASFSSSRIVIMPDCHAGIGSCIGFTMPMNDRVIPNVIGVDIGCGILSCKFDAKNVDAAAFDQYVKKNVPAGSSVNRRAETDLDFFLEVAERVGVKEAYARNSVGTLGGGNHFIEIGKGADGYIWVSVHSGSRNLGARVAEYHTKVAVKMAQKSGSGSGIASLPVHSEAGQSYIHDQQVAVKYAAANRRQVMDKLMHFIDRPVVEQIDSVHNCIDQHGMIRKGATSARLDEKLVIPFNMRDGLAICRGKGRPDWNFSAPHGAGRLMSRTKAKQQLDLKEFKTAMSRAGVYTTTATSATLDEAPGAYKDMEMILRHVGDTVEVLELVKPIYNFKSP